jgi:hypothetical protein
MLMGSMMMSHDEKHWKYGNQTHTIHSAFDQEGVATVSFLEIRIRVVCVGMWVCKYAYLTHISFSVFDAVHSLCKGRGKGFWRRRRRENCNVKQNFFHHLLLLSSTFTSSQKPRDYLQCALKQSCKRLSPSPPILYGVYI